MKKILKAMLKFLNDFSVTAFCMVHFRKQARSNCKKNHIKGIDRQYAKEIRRYWKQFGIRIPTVYHRWYTGANGMKDVKYIPEEIFYDKIERYFNDLSIEEAYCDKSIYGRLMPSVKQPKTIVVNVNGNYYDEEYNLISEAAAYDKLLHTEKFVIKPTRDSGGGKNVEFIETFLDEKAIRELLRAYTTNFIVQVPLKQHEALAAVHRESINTIRIMSLMMDGNVEIISSVLRMGVGHSKLDNISSGGINCGLDANGHLAKYAYDGSGKKYDIHPQGFEFEKGYVPSFSRIIELVKREHKNLPHFGLVSWDFTVDEMGDPVMIEFNLRWCGLNSHQLHHGGVFGERTDEILSMVLKGKTAGKKK